MQKYGVDHIISDMCMFLRREIFNAQGRFFDKNDTLVEFPLFAIMKDLVFELESLLIYLKTT
jgi:hypothetical protein